jgi:superfamily II DNA/RNA helicase
MSVRAGLDDLAALVLDEADRLLELGFAEEARCADAFVPMRADGC